MTSAENSLPPIDLDQGTQDLLQLSQLVDITAAASVQVRDKYVEERIDPPLIVHDFMYAAEAVGGAKPRVAKESAALIGSLAQKGITGPRADSIKREHILDLRAYLHKESERAKPRILRFRRGFTEMGGEEALTIADSLLTTMGVALVNERPKAIPRDEVRATQLGHVAKWLEPEWANFVRLNPGHVSEADLEELAHRYGPRDPQVVDFLLKLNRPDLR